MNFFDQAEAFLKSTTGQLVVSSLAPKPPKAKAAPAPAPVAQMVEAPKSFLQKNMIYIAIAAVGLIGAVLLMRGKR